VRLPRLLLAMQCDGTYLHHGHGQRYYFLIL
jgi:hypothetical protein